MIIIITSKLNIDCHRIMKEKVSSTISWSSRMREAILPCWKVRPWSWGVHKICLWRCRQYCAWSEHWCLIVSFFANRGEEITIKWAVIRVLPIWKFCEKVKFVKSMTSVPGPASWWELQWWSRSPCKALPERHLYCIITKTIIIIIGTTWSQDGSRGYNFTMREGDKDLSPAGHSQALGWVRQMTCLSGWNIIHKLKYTNIKDFRESFIKKEKKC